ncbi:hypothetical protein CLV33_101448 [Jejuia pallidilutea]|uniref:Uncharacterized protein n=1 Tax=Jejuia pallidilutea TaxID=504487 RepID=A0A362X465_9FLAO|nr:hypothetical protein [Jejuia pallidilutea]PQV51524.1 hypothetical protein CLV33_101448 [Jejuia pallidilutea]
MAIISDSQMDKKNISRRDVLKLAGTAGLGVLLMPSLVACFPENIKVKQLTDGPNQHWFGYYDKFQIDATGKYALANEVQPNMFRSPTLEDSLSLGLIDLENNNKWKTIGTSNAWGWQQACMLQWVPGTKNKVVWNTRENGELVSILYDIETEEKKILPKPIYTLGQKGKFGLGIDFERLQYYRPGYGYATDGKKEFKTKAPKDSGIYKIDLETGESELILSYAEVAKFDRPSGSVADNFHWINHLLISPSGTRLIFLNRSRPYYTIEEYQKANKGKLIGDSKYVTRAMTVNLDGSDLYALNDSGKFSHFIWNGDDKICAWAQPEDREDMFFCLFNDKSKNYKIVGEHTMTQNGHNTYVPNTNYEWILNDTYPYQSKERKQELYLFHVPTGKKVTLGSFYEPEAFKGEFRCDLHPRCNQQGTKVYFDSTHNGNKRQIYEIDIESIISEI